MIKFCIKGWSFKYSTICSLKVLTDRYSPMFLNASHITENWQFPSPGGSYEIRKGAEFSRSSMKTLSLSYDSL